MYSWEQVVGLNSCHDIFKLIFCRFNFWKSWKLFPEICIYFRARFGMLAKTPKRFQITVMVTLKSLNYQSYFIGTRPCQAAAFPKIGCELMNSIRVPDLLMKCCDSNNCWVSHLVVDVLADSSSFYDSHCDVWDEITRPFSNFNGATVEVWKWITYFIPHFTGHVIIYPRLGKR